MAIYDFSKAEKSEFKTSDLLQHSYPEEKVPPEPEMETEDQPEIENRSQFFSSLAARLFFFLLLIGDLLWTCYAVSLFCFSLLGLLFSWGKIDYFRLLKDKAWVSVRRSLVCGVSLLIAIFSPSFGIMIACTYFLMYDKSGIEEVVPTSLQSQIKDFFPKE
jgi:hypothetical protein